MKVVKKPGNQIPETLVGFPLVPKLGLQAHSGEALLLGNVSSKLARRALGGFAPRGMKTFRRSVTQPGKQAGGDISLVRLDGTFLVLSSSSAFFMVKEEA